MRTRTRTCLATVALAALLGGCAGQPAAPPEPIATPVDEPTDEPTDEPDPGLVLSGPPRVGWVDGSLLRLPGGRTVQLPRRWGHTSVVAYAGGWLVTDDRAFEGTVGMHRLDADGAVLDSWASTGPALPSRDGRVAWVSLVVAESGQSGPTLLHADSADGGAEVTQRVDRTWMPFLTGWFRGRLVLRTWGSAASFLTDLVHRPRAVPRAEDLGVLRPDGAYRARLVDEGLEILHADGQLSRVVRVRGLGGVMYPSLVWEDDRHVLTTITRDGRQAIARIGTGGRVSLATPWRRAGWTGIALVPPSRAGVSGRPR